MVSHWPISSLSLPPPPQLWPVGVYCVRGGCCCRWRRSRAAAVIGRDSPWVTGKSWTARGVGSVGAVRTRAGPETHRAPPPCCVIHAGRQGRQAGRKTKLLDIYIFFPRWLKEPWAPNSTWEHFDTFSLQLEQTGFSILDRSDFCSCCCWSFPGRRSAPSKLSSWSSRVAHLSRTELCVLEWLAQIQDLRCFNRFVLFKRERCFLPFTSLSCWRLRFKMWAAAVRSHRLHWWEITESYYESTCRGGFLTGRHVQLTTRKRKTK